MPIKNKLTPVAFVYILLYALSYAGLWATVRSLASEIHPMVLVFYRTLFGAILILPLFLRDDLQSLKTNQLSLYTLRGVLSISTVFLIFFALRHIPLADAVAYSYLTPIFTALLAVFFLKERFGITQILAIFIAFIGAMILLRPNFQTINIGILASLGAALGFAGALICMKILTRKDSPKLVTIYGYIIPLPLSFAFALPYWQWPNGLAIWGLLILMSLLSVVSHLSMTQALSRTDMSTILPFDFIRLVFAACLGAILFQDQLDNMSLLGGTVILFASIISSRGQINNK
ncbi:MAG: DMT family transporter [Emcibacter sp.]|nr:DMT family transporter [Emcibacter sp.]